jgi:hypothetical protein
MLFIEEPKHLFSAFFLLYLRSVAVHRLWERETQKVEREKYNEHHGDSNPYLGYNSNYRRLNTAHKYYRKLLFQARKAGFGENSLGEERALLLTGCSCCK